jgi:hypothetical protein
MHLVEDYALNLKIILTMQQLGCGKAGATIIGGLMSICKKSLNGTWVKIREELGKAQIQLGKEIVDENIHKEKKLAKEGKPEGPHVPCKHCGKFGHSQQRSSCSCGNTTF